jgi:hypothetical protein
MKRRQLQNLQENDNYANVSKYKDLFNHFKKEHNSFQHLFDGRRHYTGNLTIEQQLEKEYLEC